MLERAKTFGIVISVALFWVGEPYVAGIGGLFVDSFVLFFIALAFSAVVLQQTRNRGIEIEFCVNLQMC